MNENVWRFPMRLPKDRNARGGDSTSCILTDKWLRFANEADGLQGGSLVWVDVMMTNSDDGTEQKLCTLCVPVEELTRAVRNVCGD
jgi:hypothetical protein